MTRGTFFAVHLRAPVCLVRAICIFCVTDATAAAVVGFCVTDATAAAVVAACCCCCGYYYLCVAGQMMVIDVIDKYLSCCACACC